MYKDEIIEQVWLTRDTYAAKHNNSLREMVKDLMERQQKSGTSVTDRRDRPRTKSSLSLSKTPSGGKRDDSEGGESGIGE